MKVVGRKKYSFASKDGGLVTGVSLHCLEKAADPSEGEVALTLSVSSTKACYGTVLSVPFGSEITPVYNRYGKVDDILLKPNPIAERK